MSRRRIPRSVARACRRLAKAEDGAAAVEFAFVLPMFMLLMAGLLDGARLINASLQVRAAAQAGATYAQLNGWNPTGIAAAITAATPLQANASLPAAPFQGCIKNLQIVAPNGGGNCTSSQPVGSFVTVGANGAFKPLMPWPQVVWPTSVTANATVRIQ
ncbi:MAG: pilus assembly protein [Phenylobacterium sp.]|nr:MAG: pilus assembly protein [Phenylobacterium sp.]